MEREVWEGEIMGWEGDREGREKEGRKGRGGRNGKRREKEKESEGRAWKRKHI